MCVCVCVCVCVCMRVQFGITARDPCFLIENLILRDEIAWFMLMYKHPPTTGTGLDRRRARRAYEARRV